WSVPDGASGIDVQVLQPSDAGFCRLGTTLSHTLASDEQPCAQRSGPQSRTFAFARLAETGPLTIAARDDSGMCGGGSARGDHAELGLWQIRAGALTEV